MRLQAELAAQAQTLAEVRAALEASEQRCARLEIDDTNLRATLERRDSHIATLEADLVARQQREATLKAHLDERWRRSIRRFPICARSSRRATGASWS